MNARTPPALLEVLFEPIEDLRDAYATAGAIDRDALLAAREPGPHGRVEIRVELCRAEGRAREGRAGGRGTDDRAMDARFVQLAKDLVLDLAEGERAVFDRRDVDVPYGREERADVLDGFDGVVVEDQVDREDVVGVDPEGEAAGSIERSGLRRADLRGETLPVRRSSEAAIVDARADDFGDSARVAFQEPGIERQIDRFGRGCGGDGGEQGEGQARGGDAAVHVGRALRVSSGGRASFQSTGSGRAWFRANDDADFAGGGRRHG